MGLNIPTTHVLIYLSIIIILAFAKALIEQKPKTKRTRKRKNNVKQKPKTIRKHLTDEQIINCDLDQLSGEDFERLIEMYYTDKGYVVKRVGGAGDHEVDLIMIGTDGFKIAVQCKRWKNNVGNDTVLRLKSGKQVHGCYDAWLITTAFFTPKAIEAAERLNIRLINGLTTKSMIDSWKKSRKKGT